MDTKIHLSPIPAFRDNYIWALHNQRYIAVVDPGDAQPVRAFMAQHQLELCAIINTHHHPDHTGGNAALSAEFNIPVFGPATETIPCMTHPCAEPDTIHITQLGLNLSVFDVPGHTSGHIAYYGAGWLFCGDTLFGCGCGRLFEGTAEQMYHSLTKLSQLSGDTYICCAHEYTLSNITFALSIEPHNIPLQLRARADRDKIANNYATLPSTLSTEWATNPFLRCRHPNVVRYAERTVGLPMDNPVQVFSTLRMLKNDFH